MFLSFDARRQTSDIIALQHGDSGLGNDGPCVHASINEVDRASAFRCPGSEGITVGMSAWKIRKQGRMDVDQAAFPLCNEICRQQPHPARQNDGFDVEGLQFGLDQGFMRHPSRRAIFHGGQGNHFHRTAQRCRTFDGPGVCSIGEDDAGLVEDAFRDPLVLDEGFHPRA